MLPSMGEFVGVQGRGTIALPPELRRKYGLDRPGAQVEVVEREDGVIELHPRVPMPVIALDEKDSRFFAETVLSDAEPNEKLRRAAERYRHMTSSKDT